MLHKLKSTGHRCDDITSCNIDRLQRDVTSPQQILTYHKALHKSAGEFGGLKLPSLVFMKNITECETIFCQMYDRIYHTNGTRQKLMNYMLSSEVCFEFSCVCSGILFYVLKLFCTLRIHAAVKLMNSEIQKTLVPTQISEVVKNCAYVIVTLLCVINP